MQPAQQPRGFTIGVAVELFGIAIAVLGVASPYGTGAGLTSAGNPIIAGLGVGIALVGLVMHIARL